MLSFLGPGFLVTVGFIDPGNWATNIEGGARFGYELLWVITLSTFMLIVIQHMAAKLGIATGKSLAVNIREHFRPSISAFLGVTIVLACVATDVAIEGIGLIKDLHSEHQTGRSVLDDRSAAARGAK